MDKKLAVKMGLYSKRFLNGLLFYAGWFVCIAAAKKNQYHLALYVTLVILITHFAFYNQRRKDLILLCTLSTAGLLMDTSFMRAGWLSYQSPNQWLPEIAPFWVGCLHAIFSTTINHSLAWLKIYPFYSALLGSAGIAWTYFAGQKLGAIEILIPNPLALIAIGSIWFFYLPAVYGFSKWLDKIFGD
jgi:Protein of unknown function (DUF2878)